MSTPEERVHAESVDWKQALSEGWDEVHQEVTEEVVEVEEPTEIIEEVVEETEEVVEEIEEEIETEEVVESILSEDQKTALQYMPKDYREAVEKLDENLQNEVINAHMESEKAYRKKTMGFNDDVKLAQEIRDLLAPQKASLNGASEQQYLTQLVQTAQSLQSDPRAAFEQLARVYNYDLSTHGQEQGFTDPLQADVANLKLLMQQQAQSAQQTQLQQAQKQIDDFAADKPDFKAIEPLITAKVQQGLDLQTAYETVKGELNMTAPVEKQTSTQRVPIKQKKKAASGVKSTNSTVQRSEPMSMRDELSAGFDKLMGSK